MAILKKDLLSLRKEFKAVEKKMEMLLKAFEKTGKTPQAAAKKVVTRKSVKAKTLKKASAKKVAAEKPTLQATATEQSGNYQTIYKRG